MHSSAQHLRGEPSYLFFFSWPSNRSLFLEAGLDSVWLRIMLTRHSSPAVGGAQGVHMGGRVYKGADSSLTVIHHDLFFEPMRLNPSRDPCRVSMVYHMYISGTEQPQKSTSSSLISCEKSIATCYPKYDRHDQNVYH